MHVTKTIFPLLLLFFSVFSSAQDVPKTIYDLYNIEAGCSFYDASGKFVDEGIMIEEVPEEMAELPPPPPPSNSDGKPMTPEEEFNFLISDFQKVMASTPAFVPKNKILKNGNYCYFKNGKWGLKNKPGKVVIKPTFDQVFPDTINGGFSGYRGATSNYYDGENGKKQFKQDFYWIQSTEENVFIVRAKTGYGLVKNGKTIIEPVKQYIKKDFDGQEIYYRVSDEKIGAYILRNDLKTQFPFASWYAPRFAGPDFVVSDINIFNLKTKKKLVCKNDFYFKLISAENQLAAIKKSRDKLYYLIDFEGNIISKTGFSNIEMLNEYGVGIASVFDKNSKSRRPPEQSGLINAKGEWVVQPEQKNLFQHNEKAFWIVWTSQNLQGLLDNEGNFVISAEYTKVLEISDGRYLCTNHTKESVESKIINAKTGKVEKEGLNFHQLRPCKFCNRKLFIANVKGGEVVLDENYKPVTGVHQRIFSEGDYIVGADFNVPDVERQKRLYDCMGKPVELSINGEKVDTFQEVKVISEELIYIYLEKNNTGYFISKNSEAKSINGQMISFSPSGHEGFYTAYAQGQQNTGMIDVEGNFIIPCKLDYLAKFGADTGMACFGLRKDMAGIFTSKGELLNGKMYQKVAYPGFGLYMIKEYDKQGLVDSSGKILIAPEYDYITIMHGFIRAMKNGNESLFDITGQPIK